MHTLEQGPGHLASCPILEPFQTTLLTGLSSSAAAGLEREGQCPGRSASKAFWIYRAAPRSVISFSCFNWPTAASTQAWYLLRLNFSPGLRRPSLCQAWSTLSRWSRYRFRFMSTKTPRPSRGSRLWPSKEAKPVQPTPFSPRLGG